MREGAAEAGGPAGRRQKDGRQGGARDRRVARSRAGDGVGAGAGRAPGRGGRTYRGRYRRGRGRGADALGVAGQVWPVVADLREARECDRIVAETRHHFGRLDILVNNAGLTFTYIDPGALSPARGAALLAGVRRDRRERDGDKRPGGRPSVAPRRAGNGRPGLGPHRQRDDQARHDEPGRHAPLRRDESGARNGDRGVGQGRGRHRPHDQHRQPRRRRQHAGHGRRDARR